MDTFRQRGGEALMTLPATPLKCAGAPLKTTFMLIDRLVQAGTRRGVTPCIASTCPATGVRSLNINS